MEQSSNLTFSNQATASVVQVQERGNLSVALKAIGLQGPRPTLIVIGGASKLSAVDLARVRALFAKVLAPLAEAMGAFVIDGGTDAGVMRLMGQARAEIAAQFPLVGVTPVGLATLPDKPAFSAESSPLEAHHTHFVLIPGSQWGDESSWMVDVATALAHGAPSVVVLVNGGEITWKDVYHNVKAGRSVIVIAGSGRTADILAQALRGEAITDERAVEIIASGLLQAVDLEAGFETLATVVRTALLPKR
ncbi:MAG: hypothetical protein F6K19_35640 [Cyanothece sp. SIO1E1]|nr:hypothetical protein [Cyanothece sp. SIO1E1]